MRSFSDIETYDEEQQKFMSIGAKLAAAVSFCAASLMARTAWGNRDRLFHRLMLGIALHIISDTSWEMYGTAAVPKGTPGVWGARGTVETCTAQGFFGQMAFAIPFYYVSMSIYSFQAVRSNFELSKYLWVEKWIHVCVHIFPVGSAVYLVTLDAFNSTGFTCWVGSIPFGCGEENGIECERGPQNIEKVAILVLAVPLAFVLLCPTFVMFFMYCYVRKRQDTIKLEATAVAKQAGLYLLALYACYAFPICNKSLQIFGARKYFFLDLLAQVNINLLGVYIFLIYSHFRVKTSPSQSCTTKTPECNNVTDGKQKRKCTMDVPMSPASSKATFNIFDGTNAGGAFAEFIFDGDSEDEEADQLESNRWSTYNARASGS